MKNKNAKDIFASAGYAIILAFSLVFGFSFWHQVTNPLGNIKVYAVFILYIIILSFASYFLFQGFKRIKITENEKKIKWYFLLTAFFLMIIGWLPYWLAGYPGFFCYDAGNTFIQHFYGIEYSTHHPLLYTIYVGDVFKLAVKLSKDNYNLGIIILSWVQILVGASVFTYMCAYVYKLGGYLFFWISVAYLSFFPTIGLFSSCSTKDIFNSFVILLLFLQLLEAYNQSEDKGIKLYTLIINIFLVALLLLFRKNNLVAFVIFLPVLFLLFKKERVKLGIILMCGFLLFFAGSKGLEMRYHPMKGSLAEVICVPMQQLARVYVQEGDSMFIEDELDYFNSIHPYSLDNYHELNADFSKAVMDDNILRKTFPRFLKMWARIGLKHPKVYIEAFLANTYQAWYPFCDITGYYDNISEGSTYYFKCDVELPGQLESKLPAFYDILWNMSHVISLYKIPVVGILFSIAFYYYMLLLVFFYGGICKGNKKALLYSTFIYMFVLSTFFGPIVLPRYYIYLYHTFPLMLGFLAEANKNSTEKK